MRDETVCFDFGQHEGEKEMDKNTWKKKIKTIGLIVSICICLFSAANSTMASAPAADLGERYYQSAIEYFKKATSQDNDINMAKGLAELEKSVRTGYPKALLSMGELLSMRQDTSGKRMALGMFHQYKALVTPVPKYVEAKITELEAFLETIQKM